MEVTTAETTGDTKVDNDTTTTTAPVTSIATTEVDTGTVVSATMMVTTGIWEEMVATIAEITVTTGTVEMEVTTTEIGFQIRTILTAIIINEEIIGITGITVITEIIEITETTVVATTITQGVMKGREELAIDEWKEAGDSKHRLRPLSQNSFPLNG